MRLPLYLTWKLLKELLGHPYCRTHTMRLMEDGYEVDRYFEGKGYEPVVIRNLDPFPRAVKAGPFPNSPLLWYCPAVLAWYQRRGLPVPEGIDFSS